MFRRRRSGQPDPEAADLETGTEVDDLEESDASDDTAPAGIDRSQGPFDLTEAPEDGLTRLDLGGLRVAGADGMELRLEVDEASQQVVGVTCVTGDSALQLTAFAAPRTEGIWDDVRREIRGNLAATGNVDELDGPFGRELWATLPVAGPGGAQGVQPVRFVGIDGPRWFLRGLFSGPAARDPQAAVNLEAVLRATVVVRGSDPMAPGDAIPLTIPSEVPEGMEKKDDGDGRTTLPPPQRGPEITEIR